MEVKQRPYYGWLAVQLVFAGLFLFFGLGYARLIDWDENIYAEASRQMLLRGDYLNIVINEHPFAEKPPFFFWEQVISYRLFGVNEFAARFPSAFAGMLMILLCYYIGRRIDSPQTGLLWGLVHLTALLPACFARAAVIDFTFNLFITVAAFFLYLYDVAYRNSLDHRPPSDRTTSSAGKPWFFLTIASMAMGLAVLTKGPLGGVIPLVGFAGYKWVYRHPGIRLLHFGYCAFVALTVGFSWYVVNGWLHGGSFVRRFWEFQLALFSRSLEGHEGPFFYHWLVVIIGLAPWTAFLLLFRPAAFYRLNVHFRPLIVLGLSWTVFVLVLMSFVSTKLPHYSASVYIPLTLIIAGIIRQQWQSGAAFPFPFLAALAILMLGLAVLVLLVPILADHYLIRQGVTFEFNWPDTLAIAGSALLALGILAVLLFGRRKTEAALGMTVLYTFVLTQSLWCLLVPPFLSYIQQPLIDMVHASHRQGGKVVFYRLVSFAALFYGKQPIEMLHTYKFPGNPDILNRRQAHNLYVVADKSQKTRLTQEHPLVRHLEDRGTFSWFVLDKE